MPPFALKQYLTQLDDAWSRRRGGVAAEFLSLRDQHADGTLLAGHTNDQLELQCQRCLAPPLDDLAAAHLRCVRSLSDGDCTQAFTHQSAVVSVFAKAFVTHKDDNWALPVMYAVCLDLRRVAAGADAERVRAGTGFSGELLEKAAEGMMACFRVCAGDTRAEVSDTKRWGLLTLVNQLFKIYFRVQKLHLCRPLVRAIESLPFSNQFSLAQQLTYHYYIGCKAMFDCQYAAAKESLMFAFTRCHRSSHKNKRLILVYLIPVCMLLGSMPRDSLLTKYRLRQFAPVVAAVRQGSLGRLSAAMNASQTFFISCGVYLILEKLRTITQRNLFKKVCEYARAFTSVRCRILQPRGCHNALASVYACVQ